MNCRWLCTTRGLKSAGAQAWGAAGDVPGVLVHKIGKGHAVVLNTKMEGYESLHNAGTASGVVALAGRLLALAGVRPTVRVMTSDGRPTDACEIIRFTDGPIQYLAIVPDPFVAGLKPQNVTVMLPHAAHVYDIRAKESRGHTKVIEAHLVPGEPTLLALLPYAINAVTAIPTSSEVASGQPARFRVRLDVGTRQLAAAHCLRIDVFDPDGQAVRHYAQNVLTKTLPCEVSVPLALSDRPGRWQIRATDVASGQSATTTVVFQGPSRGKPER